MKGLALGVYLQAHDGTLPEIQWPTWLSEQWKHLILKMICYEPRERCEISEVREGLRKIRLDPGKLTRRQSHCTSNVNNLGWGSICTVHKENMKENCNPY